MLNNIKSKKDQTL